MEKGKTDKIAWQDMEAKRPALQKQGEQEAEKRKKRAGFQSAMKELFCSKASRPFWLCMLALAAVGVFAILAYVDFMPQLIHWEVLLLAWIVLFIFKKIHREITRLRESEEKIRRETEISDSSPTDIGNRSETPTNEKTLGQKEAEDEKN